MNDITDLRAAGESGRSDRRGGREATHLVAVAATETAEASPDVLSISCDDCSMRCTSACDDCLVTFLIEQGDDSLVLDLDQARVVRLLGEAGLVPNLKFSDAG